LNYRKLLIDLVRAGDYAEKDGLLELLNFPVYWITVQSYYQNIMHEKFCVIDLYTSIHGTFNWIKAANFNKEHISIDRNHSIAAAFADEFMKLKNKKVWNS